MRKRNSNLPPSRGYSAKKRKLTHEIEDMRRSRVAAPSNPEIPSAGQAQLIGSLEAIVDGTVEGWAMNVQTPTNPVTVEIFDGDQLLGSAAAFMFRSDLLAAGIGTGNHYFKFSLPESAFDGQVHVISARFAGSAENLANSPTYVGQSAPQEPLEVDAADKLHPIAFGVLEVVSDEGWVKGWAWYPKVPERRVEIEVLVDGELVGETIAEMHRADLVAAGVGDGDYSFALVLPYEVLTRPKDSLVSVRDKRTGQLLAEPRLLHRREIINAIEKLSELENDARLLSSTVTLASDRAAADERAAADLFRTVGDFFVQLANATAAGRPPGSLKTLRGAVEEITSRFPPIEFSALPDPQLSICVEATGSLETIYNTLYCLSGFPSSVATELVIFDPGLCDEAPLLPLVVRNIRYIHVGAGSSPASALNSAAKFTRGEIILFLAGFAEPTHKCLETVSAVFRADSSIALVGAKIIRSDGVLDSAGITITNERPEVLGFGANPASEAFLHKRRIDAVSGEAFAVRRDVWQHCRGLNESMASRESALGDFCKRVSAMDGKLFYEPEFEVLLRR